MQAECSWNRAKHFNRIKTKLSITWYVLKNSPSEYHQPTQLISICTAAGIFCGTLLFYSRWNPHSIKTQTVPLFHFGMFLEPQLTSTADCLQVTYCRYLPCVFLMLAQRTAALNMYHWTGCRTVLMMLEGDEMRDWYLDSKRWSSRFCQACGLFNFKRGMSYKSMQQEFLLKLL